MKADDAKKKFSNLSRGSCTRHQLSSIRTETSLTPAICFRLINVDESVIDGILKSGTRLLTDDLVFSSMPRHASETASYRKTNSVESSSIIFSARFHFFHCLVFRFNCPRAGRSFLSSQRRINGHTQQTNSDAMRRTSSPDTPLTICY